MNALFMPFAPLVSGRIWQGLDAKDKDVIRKLVAQSLDAQINDIVTTEAGLIEKFKGTSIAFKTASSFNPDGIDPGVRQAVAAQGAADCRAAQGGRKPLTVRKWSPEAAIPLRCGPRPQRQLQPVPDDHSAAPPPSKTPRPSGARRTWPTTPSRP